MEYDKIEESIVRAVFSMNAAEVKRLMADSPILHKRFEDIDYYIDNMYFEDHIYPIYYIPQLWEICLRDAKLWDDEAHDRIVTATIANAEIKRMLLKDGPYTYRSINFYYPDVTFYSKKNTESDILDRPRQQLIDEGVRELDIDLFVAVHQYRFDEVDRLLTLGANPNREINRDPRDKTCLVSIEEGLSFNMSHVVDYALSYGIRSAEDFQIGDLFYLYGWAAGEKMITLVNTHNPTKYMSEKVAETYNEASHTDELYALCCDDMRYSSVREGCSCTSRDMFIGYLYCHFNVPFKAKVEDKRNDPQEKVVIESKPYEAKVVDKATDGSIFVKIRRRYDKADTFILRVMLAKDKIDGFVKIGAITKEEYSPSLETDNPFSLKGMEFGDYVWKMDFGCFDDLMPLMEPLDCLSIRQGYVLDAFEFGDSLGSYFKLYCRKEGSEIMYQEPKEDVMQKNGRVLFRLAENKELPPYTDDMYLQGMYSHAVSELIPEIWPYITAEFSSMAVWQCYLLHIASSSFMSLGWRPKYPNRDNIFVPSDLKGVRADCSEYYDDPQVLPSVELTGDNEAVVSCCYWNYRQGLVREAVKVTFVDGHVQFGESELTTLVPCRNGLCY